MTFNLQAFYDASDENKEAVREGMLHGDRYEALDKALEEAGVEAEVVESNGGEEQGSDYYHVWRFFKGDEELFWKVHGWYASYHGTDYEGFGLVTKGKPVQYQWNAV